MLVYLLLSIANFGWFADYLHSPYHKYPKDGTNVKMDPQQYFFDPFQQVVQPDTSTYHEQFAFGHFEHSDGCLNSLDLVDQACLAPSTSSLNQALMQRFLKDTQRALFNPIPPHILASNAQPVESLPPIASHHRQESPFSSQELSSCSSARSPRADSDLCADKMPSTPPSMAMFHSFQASSSFEMCEPQPSFFLSAMGGIQTENHPCVSMTEIHAADEITSDWNTSHPVIDFSSTPRSYTFSSQTSVSQQDVTSRQPSVDHEYKHAPSPAPSAIIKEEISLPEQLPFAVNMSASYPTPSVRDSEGSDVEMEVASPASDDNDGEDDDDYRPDNKTRTSSSARRTPRNKRIATRSLDKSLPKRTKIDSSSAAQSARPLPPSSSGGKGPLICTECSHSFKDEVTLQSHIKKQHTRPFICVFRFAGCASTFASKNEWKRHVMSQHLVLHYWLCDIDICAHNKNSLTTAKPSRRNKAARRAAEQTLKLESIGPPLPDGAIFNRKDLYTQHIRRMHTPVHVQKAAKATKKGSASSLTVATAEWDEQVKDLQTSALRERCQLPTYMQCPALHCTQSFSGADAWDQRMEHVAKHLERAAVGQEQPVVFGGPTDPSLMSWVTSAEVAVVRSMGPGAWVLNNPLRAASEGRGVGRKREVFLASLSSGATATSSLVGSSSAVSPAERSPSVKNEIFVDEGEEDAEGEEE